MKRRPKLILKSSSEITPFAGLTRSELMSRVRSTGNKTTELRIVQLLRASGITGWRRHLKLLGKPDFTWPKHRVVLFIHGCFWHGHDCGRQLTPRKNPEFWLEKINGNRARDRRNRRKLRLEGWTVLTIWECQVAKSPDKCVARIAAAIS